MKLDVFGKLLEVSHSESGWIACYLGNDGKKRPANELVIPVDLSRQDVVEYLSDLCHEWATPQNSEVKVID